MVRGSGRGQVRSGFAFDNVFGDFNTQEEVFGTMIPEFLAAFRETYPKLEEFNRVRISKDSSGYDAGFSKEGAS